MGVLDEASPARVAQKCVVVVTTAAQTVALRPVASPQTG